MQIVAYKCVETGRLFEKLCDLDAFVEKRAEEARKKTAYKALVARQRREHDQDIKLHEESFRSCKNLFEVEDWLKDNTQWFRKKINIHETWGSRSGTIVDIKLYDVTFRKTSNDLVGKINIMWRGDNAPAVPLEKYFSPLEDFDVNGPKSTPRFLLNLKKFVSFDQNKLRTTRTEINRLIAEPRSKRAAYLSKPLMLETLTGTMSEPQAISKMFSKDCGAYIRFQSNTVPIDIEFSRTVVILNTDDYSYVLAKHVDDLILLKLRYKLPACKIVELSPKIAKKTRTAHVS